MSFLKNVLYGMKLSDFDKQQKYANFRGGKNEWNYETHESDWGTLGDISNGFKFAFGSKKNKINF